MNPQIMALLQALMGGGSNSLGFGDQPNLVGDYRDFTLGGAQSGGNEAIARAVGGYSPVNQNPNYGNTVSRFFNQNPLAGSQAFTGANPLQSGSAGQNAMRSFKGHSSFLPNDFSSAMQQWI